MDLALLPITHFNFFLSFRKNTIRLDWWKLHLKITYSHTVNKISSYLLFVVNLFLTLFLLYIPIFLNRYYILVVIFTLLQLVYASVIWCNYNALFRLTAQICSDDFTAQLSMSPPTFCLIALKIPMSQPVIQSAIRLKFQKSFFCL